MSKTTGRRFRPRLEPLEWREVPAGFTAATVPELIAAMDAANLTPEADTITLAAGKTFTLTGANNGATGLPVIPGGEDLTIVGNGSIIERSRAKGTPPFRLLDVAAGGSLELRDLTLQGGQCYAAGGAIYSIGSLALDRVTVQNNVAEGYSWSDFGGWYLPGGAAYGGGVYSAGSLSVAGCTIRSNTAVGGRGAPGSAYSGDGGGWSGHIAGAPGGNAYGGGIYVAGGTAIFTSTTISQNTAEGGAGGKGRMHGDPAGADGLGQGGGSFIAPGAGVQIDAFTVAHTKGNHASTADDNISGTYGTVN